MLFKNLILLQSIYYLILGVWPLIDIQSFMWVSGPKIDIWLVKTVGLLTAVIGSALLVYDRKRSSGKTSSEIKVLAIGSAISFIIIDVYYALNDIIWNVYLVDAAIEGVIVLLWLFLIKKERD